MARPGQALASRFNRMLERLEEERKREEEARAKRLLEAQTARADLFENLGAFAEAVGHLQVQAKPGEEGLTLRYLDQFIHFAPKGEADRVEVRFAGSDGQEHRLYREPELGNRWVWVASMGGREDRLPLFDQGLEELLVRGLALPRPAQGMDDVPADTGTLEDAIPSERTL
jgi:hypothetical protein